MSRKYSPKRDIPKAIKELKNTSPLEISKYLSNKYNQEISADSISKWFKRNPHKKKKLEREISKKPDEIRKKVWDCIERGESKEETMKNTQCSKTYYYQMLKEYENYRKILKEDESKDVHIIEHIEEPKINNHMKQPLPVSVEKTRVPARNPVYPQKKSPIKLKLDTFPNYQSAMRHALDNYYRWISYNIQEIKTYMKDRELKLNPVTIEVITRKEVYIRADILMREYHDRPDKAKELYDILGIVWKKPACSIWIERLLYLWEISHAHAGLKKAELTTKEWYEEMEIDFPQSLEREANDFITNRSDLDRAGIPSALEYKIKKALGIDDEMEKYYHTTEKLNKIDRFHIQNLIRENQTHPYSVLLIEKLQDNDNIK